MKKIFLAIILLSLTSCASQKAVNSENGAARRAHSVETGAIEVWDTGSERGWLQYASRHSVVVDGEVFHCRVYRRFYRNARFDLIDDITYCYGPDGWYVESKSPMKRVWWFER